jgi:pentose-5-phosphate-3-epimerase
MPHVVTLSASIRSVELAHLADTVKLTEPRADVFHDDIMDARSVPPLASGSVVMAAPRPHIGPIRRGHLQALDTVTGERDLAFATGWGN